MIESIQSISRDIRASKFTNEDTISIGIVMRLLQEMGWDVYDSEIVCRGYTLGETQAHYALCSASGKPTVLIAIKQANADQIIDNLLLESAQKAAIPLVIFTTGRKWFFFLSADQSKSHEVYQLDLLDCPPIESANRLQRYLSFEAINSSRGLQRLRIRSALQRYLKSGLLASPTNAVSNAVLVEQLSQSETTPRLINESPTKTYTVSSQTDTPERVDLQTVWDDLVEGEDKSLIEIVADQVYAFYEYRPKDEAVLSFLRDLHIDNEDVEPAPTPPKQRLSPVQKEVLVTPISTREATSVQKGAAVVPVSDRRSLQPGPVRHTRVGITFFGEEFPAKSARGVLIRTYQQLARRDPTFLDRFAQSTKNSKNRRYLAKSPEDLFISSPHLAKESYTYRRLFPDKDWYIDVNLSKSRIEDMVKRLCKFEGIEFGKDLIIRMD